MSVSMSDADVRAHQIKVAARRSQQSTVAGIVAGAHEAKMKKATQRLDAARDAFAIRPSHDEDRLNKTERAYLAHLRSQSQNVWIGVQNLTVKLADDCRLTPDFAVLDRSGKLALVDVKGFQREDALIKMKVAARLFPMFTFYIVKRDGGGWLETIVRP